MNILMKLAPHAVILIGNMYYVFWGIDRVNKSMNFIDNPYTKFLLLVMIACSLFSGLRLGRVHLNRLGRTDNPTPVYARLSLLALNLLLAAAILVLLIIDLFNEDLLLFLSEFVKILILILSVTGLLNSLQLIARDRAIVRAEMRRRAQMRRQPPRQSAPRYAQPYAARPQYGGDPRARQPRYDDRYARPQSSRYDDFRPQPARYAGDSRPRPQQRPGGYNSRPASRPANRY